MSEIWKPIEGHNGAYEVSNTGKVRSWKGHNQNCPKRKTPKLLNQFVNNGYYKISLHNKGNTKRGIAIHRIVSEAFIPNTENKPFVNHKDGNKLNNHVSNLEWCTPQENHEHAAKTGLMERGEDRHCSKLTKPDVIAIRKIYNSEKDVSQRVLARQYNVSQRLIWNIVNNVSWVHV